MWIHIFSLYLTIIGNAHARGADYQTQEGGEMRQKQPDEVDREVCGNLVQLFGSNIQFNRGVEGGTHQGSRGVQISWEAVGPVGQRLAIGPT